jgi:putative flavoprotein involved in K+ transport
MSASTEVEKRGGAADAEGHYDVAVIGAGQAGLAIAHFLARQGRRFVVLDRADTIGSAWHGRWDSLVLFTPRRYNSLPGRAFPGDADAYPTRDAVIAYPRRVRAGVRVAARAGQRGAGPVQAGGQVRARAA